MNLTNWFQLSLIQGVTSKPANGSGNGEDDKKEIRLAISIMKDSCKETENIDGMTVYTLPLETTILNASFKFRRFSFGRISTDHEIKKKTILLVGATGSGKTTWINAMINYVLGVEWDDPFRSYSSMRKSENLRELKLESLQLTTFTTGKVPAFLFPWLSSTPRDTPVGWNVTKKSLQPYKNLSTIQMAFRYMSVNISFNHRHLLWWLIMPWSQELDTVGFVIQGVLTKIDFLVETLKKTFVFWWLLPMESRHSSWRPLIKRLNFLVRRIRMDCLVTRNSTTEPFTFRIKIQTMNIHPSNGRTEWRILNCFSKKWTRWKPLPFNGYA